MKSPVSRKAGTQADVQTNQPENKGVFRYVLPNGQVVKDASEEDLFDAFTAALNEVKESLRDLIGHIDRCLISEVKECKRVAAKRRGRIAIVRNAVLTPVDIHLSPREVRP